MTPPLILFIFIIFLVIFGLLNRGSASKTAIQNQTEDSSPTSYEFPEPVTFEIKELNSVKEEKGQRKTWLATYEREGKSTSFTIELLLKELPADQPYAFSEGSIHRGEGDSTLLIEDLQRALSTTKKSEGVNKQDEITFSLAILGTELSRNPTPNDVVAGSFSQNPKGDWITTKLFLGDGSGEVYLNLNSKEHKGEFSIKDPEYGDAVMSELYKIL